MIRSVLVPLFFLPISFVPFGKQASTEEQLANGRKQIDAIDRQIVALVNQRAAVVQNIGKIKKAAGVPIAAPSREQEVLKRVSEDGSPGPLPVYRLRTIYSTLLGQMRDWEQEQHNPTIQSETVLRTSLSWNGMKYNPFPIGPPELSVLKITIPPHRDLHWHTHPMPNVGFVLSGEITAEQPDGKQRHFSTGEAIPETVNTVHRGHTDDQAAVLLVFYAGVQGMALAQPKQ